MILRNGIGASLLANGLSMVRSSLKCELSGLGITVKRLTLKLIANLIQEPEMACAAEFPQEGLIPRHGLIIHEIEFMTRSVSFLSLAFIRRRPRGRHEWGVIN